MKPTLAAIAAMTLFGLTTAPAVAQTNLTMWQNGDCPQDACIERALVDAFEAANPDIKIELINQPPDGYFTIAVDGMADLHQFIISDEPPTTKEGCG